MTTLGKTVSGHRGGSPVPGLTLRAPAKVNLCLHVLGRRPDGYHELASLAVFAGVSDEIELRPSDRWSIEVRGPFSRGVPATDANLVVRAARALATQLGVSDALAVVLTKNVPVAAGLGGGSSDAATTLRALPALWGRAVDSDRLRSLGAALGADIPFCLGDEVCVLGGAGDRLTPVLGWPALSTVLVNAGKPLETRAVFSAWQAPGSGPLSRPPTDSAGIWRFMGAVRNDLTAAAIGLDPTIAEVLAALDRTTGCRVARMSGSGGTCFALYGSEGEAADAANELKSVHSSWWVRATRLGARAQVVRCDA
ncbi:MAG: 4-(cytidine 5'-diphospho)-2-C-methyl-D-erythritol kinase [Alphaproteobacteria bacterium]|nr:4-(cytidine 5'-diphospho)-2-C-methyl-D-erythritol kinase [Alphaproteobacteria bacterium]